jgi:hypothetical protein
MESRRQIINSKLKNRESVVDHVIGFYVEVGNQHSPCLNVPIFNAIKKTETNTVVQIDYLGSAMWINVRPERVFVGEQHRIYGQNKQRTLETIKYSNYYRQECTNGLVIP